MPLAFKWQREGTAKEGRVCKYKVAPSSGPPSSFALLIRLLLMYDSQVHNSQNINISAALTKCICLGIRAPTTRILKSLVNLSKYALSFSRFKTILKRKHENV